MFLTEQSVSVAQSTTRPWNAPTLRPWRFLFLLRAQTRLPMFTPLAPNVAHSVMTPRTASLHAPARTPRVALCGCVTIIVILWPARCQRARAIFSLVPSLWPRPPSHSPGYSALLSPGCSSSFGWLRCDSPALHGCAPSGCSSKPASHAPRIPGSWAPNGHVLRLFTLSAQTPGHASGFLSVVASFPKAPCRSGIGFECPFRAHKPQRWLSCSCAQ